MTSRDPSSQCARFHQRSEFTKFYALIILPSSYGLSFYSPVDFAVCVREVLGPNLEDFLELLRPANRRISLFRICDLWLFTNKQANMADRERKDKRGHEDRKSTSSQKSVDGTTTTGSRSKSTTSSTRTSTSSTSGKSSETPQTSTMPVLTLATGSPNCPAGSTATSQAPPPAPAIDNSRTEARVDELFRMMHCLMQRFDGFEQDDERSEGEHVLSCSDDDAEDDPLEHMSHIISDMAEVNRPSTSGHGDQFSQALADLAGSFHDEEEKGEPLAEDLARILNTALRKKPVDSSVKATVSLFRLPSNVPNLTVPSTNSDISNAMSPDGKKIDSNLSQINNLLARAIVPVAGMVNDIGSGAVKETKSYLSHMNSAIRLMVAAFNYINQTRKLVAKAHIKEEALGKICRWEHEVGETELFPFDVTKKVEELNKTKKLGAPPKKFSSFKAPGPNKSTFRKAPYFKRRPQQVQGYNKYAQAQGSSSRPFLGKPQSHSSQKSYRSKNY